MSPFADFISESGSEDAGEEVIARSPSPEFQFPQDESGEKERGGVQCAVKNEPEQEDKAAAAALSGGQVITKKEDDVEDIFRRHAMAITGQFKPPILDFPLLNSIPNYAGDRAIHALIKMLQHITKILLLMNFDNSLRQQTFHQAIETLMDLSGKRSETVIAICGATGVGKSSLLNALLGDHIVPTSSMRACTSVVTEIKYHDDEAIVADVHFLERVDWEEEVAMILGDLGVEEGSTITKPGDLDSPAGIAWRKVLAVYPSLLTTGIGRMTISEVIASDEEVASLLGTCKKVEAQTPEQFGREFAMYIDSGPASNARPGVAAQELWPLISKVTIYCNAEVLSNGATFVDLPGVDDSNTARNSIAEEFMKKAAYIFILGSINRAVSDKTAHHLMGEGFKYQLMLDGHYDNHSVTFIPTKCDQLVCSEVEKELDLRSHKEWQAIQARIDEVTERCQSHKRLSEQLRAEVEQLETRQRWIEQSLAAISNNVAPGRSNFFLDPSATGKRKIGEVAAQRPLKRAHLAGSADSGQGGSEAQAKEELEKQLETVRNTKESTQKRLMEVFFSPPPIDDLETAKREKMRYCSLKRSEWSRVRLKEDFRSGLRVLDDKLAEESDPEGFDPQKVRRDYEKINLPVFPCSSQDYTRITTKDHSDGPPTCFIDIEDTGIPALRRYCHSLALETRERAARHFISEMSTFVKTVQSFAHVAEATSAADQETLRRQWETQTASDGGITRRLNSIFGEQIDEFVAELQGKFQHALADECVFGARKCISGASQALSDFTENLHWSTYRAVIRRRGKYKNLNLNHKLSEPLILAVLFIRGPGFLGFQNRKGFQNWKVLQNQF